MIISVVVLQRQNYQTNPVGGPGPDGSIGCRLQQTWRSFLAVATRLQDLFVVLNLLRSFRDFDRRFRRCHLCNCVHRCVVADDADADAGHLLLHHHRRRRLLLLHHHHDDNLHHHAVDDDDNFGDSSLNDVVDVVDAAVAVVVADAGDDDAFVLCLCPCLDLDRVLHVRRHFDDLHLHCHRFRRHQLCHLGLETRVGIVGSDKVVVQSLWVCHLVGCRCLLLQQTMLSASVVDYDDYEIDYCRYYFYRRTLNYLLICYQHQ